MGKIALVLEGGGMRGAYTAGCLSWLIDENIKFDAAYGISTGAVHLCTYLSGDKELLHAASTKYIASDEVIGIKAFFREHQIVSYDYLFNELLVKTCGFRIEDLKTDVKAKIGLYDMNIGKTIYKPIEEMTTDLLKAACSLPLLGKVVKVGDKQYLDGGITEMIPINESLKDENDKHLVITTKPIDYVRKPSNKIVVELMRLAYPNCPNISKDYNVRHINYNKQIKTINDCVKTGDAYYRYPSMTINVSRLKGKPEDLQALYDLGYKDMENSKEQIYKVLECAK